MGRKEQRRKGKEKGKEVKEESLFGRKVAGSEKNLTMYCPSPQDTQYNNLQSFSIKTFSLPLKKHEDWLGLLVVKYT